MERRSVQAPAAVIMIRPHRFAPNPETAGDNAFQRSTSALDPATLAARAHREATDAARTLTALGVRVHVFEDEGADTPDSVFPNNWFSTHPGGHVAIYPMYATNRRRERRADVIETLKREYRVQDVIDYSALEHDAVYLEGTGAMVLDHLDRVAYAARSNRTDPVALERFCTHFNYEPIVFDAADAAGAPVYHTNVLMCIATDFVLIGLELIGNERRRREIERRFVDSGRRVIALSGEQIGEFAGNAIELQARDGRVLAISARALDALSAEQRAIIEESATLAPLSVATIKLAGGSVRCMLAGVHLSPR